MGISKAEENWIKVYIVIEAVLLIAIKSLQSVHAGRTINYVMYAAIVMNSVVAAYYYFRYGRSLKDKHPNLIALALLMTLAADFFATLIGRWASYTAYTFGIALFCVTEIIYAVYLRAGKGTVILRAVLAAAGIVLVRKMGMTKPDTILGLVNEVLVLVNVVDAWAAKRIDPPMLFKVGITLFFCCDTSIVIRALASGAVKNAAWFMVWVFYVPAQVLITLAYVKYCTRRWPD